MCVKTSMQKQIYHAYCFLIDSATLAQIMICQNAVVFKTRRRRLRRGRRRSKSTTPITAATAKEDEDRQQQ